MESMVREQVEHGSHLAVVGCGQVGVLVSWGGVQKHPACFILVCTALGKGMRQICK